MKNNKLGRVLNRSLFLALTLVFNVFAFAQPSAPPNPGGGAGGTGPGAPEKVPIDMYEGLLLVVAVMFIVGMYYYNKRRKLA